MTPEMKELASQMHFGSRLHFEGIEPVTQESVGEKVLSVGVP